MNSSKVVPEVRVTSEFIQKVFEARNMVKKLRLFHTFENDTRSLISVNSVLHMFA